MKVKGTRDYMCFIHIKILLFKLAFRKKVRYCERNPNLNISFHSLKVFFFSNFLFHLSFFFLLFWLKVYFCLFDDVCISCRVISNSNYDSLIKSFLAYTFATYGTIHRMVIFFTDIELATCIKFQFRCSWRKSEIVLSI